jgi:general stress protein 26
LRQIGTNRRIFVTVDGTEGVLGEVALTKAGSGGWFNRKEGEFGTMAENQVDKLKGLLERLDSAMLITHAEGERIRARPMAIARVEANCDLWFVTGKGSPKVEEIQNNQQVNVVCQDGEKVCISISGRAEMVNDRRKLDEVWKEAFKVWFPGGKEDPEIRLIFVRGEEAEYWDTHGSKGVRYVFSAVKGYATGERPEIQEGEQHAKVKLQAV